MLVEFHDQTRTSMVPADFICTSHPRAPYKGVVFDGQIWVYCAKCARVLNRRPFVGKGADANDLGHLASVSVDT